MRCPQCEHDPPLLTGHGWYLRAGGYGVKRLWCPVCHKTCSLLPDFLCAHLSGQLEPVEEAVARAEQGGTREQAVDELRPDKPLQGNLRWLDRRVHALHLALLMLIRSGPVDWHKLAPTLEAFRQQLAAEDGQVLRQLRRQAKGHLHRLPAPLGFRSFPEVRQQGNAETGRSPPGQHNAGVATPAAVG